MGNHTIEKRHGSRRTFNSTIQCLLGIWHTSRNEQNDMRSVFTSYTTLTTLKLCTTRQIHVL